MVGLRAFRPEDAEILREALFPQSEIGEVRALFKEWDARSFEGRYFEMFAVERDGRLVGSASLYEHSPSVVSAGVEIFPAEKGQGSGGAALGLLVGAAAEKGYRIVQDQVRPDNLASVRLHEACGFETCD